MVFLIDGSLRAGPEFQYIRTLIERLVGSLDVGFDTTRVAVIQFGEEQPKVEFPLNAYSSTEEVRNAVRQLQPRGGRQVGIGSALDFVASQVFKRPLGSRIEEGVPQFLVLISAGKSGDEVDDSAVELKRLGVAPFAVGRNMEPEELVKLSLSPEYVFSVSTFRELPRLEQRLLTPIATLTSQQIKQLLASTVYPPPGERGARCGCLSRGGARCDDRQGAGSEIPGSWWVPWGRRCTGRALRSVRAGAEPLAGRRRAREGFCWDLSAWQVSPRKAQGHQPWPG